VVRRSEAHRLIVAFVLAAGFAGAAAAQEAPSNPPQPGGAERHHVPRSPPALAIPEGFAPPQEAYASFPESDPAPAPAVPSACQLRLARIATFQPLPVLVGPGECGAADAVSLQEVILPDQVKVPLDPPATLRCPMAEEVAHWIREDVAPTAVKFGPPLRGVDNYDSYECRGRNRVRGATLSEHGRANALDVRGFRLADGRTVGLTDVTVDRTWREAVRASVCARFSTVLGPGSDGSHEEHIHLDLAERRNGFKLCEWDVRTPVVEAKTKEPAPEAKTAADPPPDAPETADADEDAAPLPADMVPLPRPRPKIGRIAERHAVRHTSFDGPLAVTPQ